MICLFINRYRYLSLYVGNLLVSVAVVVAFFICWAPFHAQRLVAIYGGGLQAEPPYKLKIYEIITYVSGILYYVSTTVNPVLYHIMSNKFREAFKVRHSLGYIFYDPIIVYSSFIPSTLMT